MKLCTYLRNNGSSIARAGIVRHGLVYDIKDCLAELKPELGRIPAAGYSSIIGILEGGRPALDALRRLEDAVEKKGADLNTDSAVQFQEDLTLLAPVPRPNSIRDFLVFEEHLINSMHTAAKQIFRPAAWLNSLARTIIRRPLIRPPRAWYEMPTYYKGNPDTVIGQGEPVIWPSYTEKLDYELEFGIYILGRGRDISEADAGNYIAGYTIFNDFSARDIQMREMAARLGPAKGKDFDTSNVMGPYLVTPDEIPDPYALNMEAYVNDELWSKGMSDGMHFSFEQMIEHVSRSETLYPGDFFGSGTVGTGCGLELDRWIQPGDKVTLKVDKLGELSNTVVREE